jgi:FkbM family methyltransferase
LVAGKLKMDFRDMAPPDWLKKKALAETGVVIFGAGAGGHMLHEFFSRTAVPVKAFLDNYSSGRVCLGQSVFPGNASPTKVGVSLETPVIISVVNFFAHGRDDAEACREQLKTAGWHKVATRPEWLTALFCEHQGQIDTVNRLWADEKSRALYGQALRFLTSRVQEHEPSVQPIPYFPSDVPTFSAQALRWVQGGAYTGDTLNECFSLGVKIEEAAFFEPDQVNYSQLAANVQACGGLKATCWPCGLWEKTEALRFNSGRGTDSAVDPDGDVLIQGVDLDSALPTFKPNLITLDVEGAELKALEGMRRTITKYRPNLAISIYHCPDDWWRIPLWIYALNQHHNLTYELNLRVHASLATDAILYAVDSR